MIYIHKGDIPAVFLEAKRKYNHYDDLPHDIKEKLKSILIEEQGGICAYCMGRIKADTSTIEHYIPRNGENGNPDLSIDYINLLAVCTNARNDSRRERQCDVSRGNTHLEINPCQEKDIEHIRYKNDGEIFSDIEKFNEDLCKTLNLNNQVLKNNRKTAWKTVLLAMDKNKKGNWKKEYIQKWIDKYKMQNPKSEYVGIILYELKKRLKRAT